MQTPQPVIRLIQRFFLFFFFFSKILPKFDFEVDFSMQFYASLTHEYQAYL